MNREHSRKCKCNVCNTPANPIVPTFNCNDLHFVSGDNSVTIQALDNCTFDFRTVAGDGTVTSVGLTMPTGFSVSGSPVTEAGVLAVTTNLNGNIRGNGSGFVVGPVNLNTEVTGILQVNNGGTGLNSLGVAGQVIRVNAGGTGLEYGTVGNPIITLTGDVTGSGTPNIPTVISNDAVTFPKMQNIPSATLLGRTSIGVGDVETITVGAGLQLFGGVLSSTGGSGSVTNFQFTSANGFSGVVINPTTTPNLTLKTSLTDKSVPFIGPAGELLENNASFFWDDILRELTIDHQINTDVIKALSFGDGFLTLTTPSSIPATSVYVNNDGLGVGAFAGGAHTARINVLGNVQSSDAFVLDNVGVIGEFYIDSNAIGMRSTTNHSLTFKTNDNLRLEIDNTGELQATSYPNTRNDGSTTKALYTDGAGNILLGDISTPIGGADTGLIVDGSTVKLGQPYGTGALTSADIATLREIPMSAGGLILNGQTGSDNLVVLRPSFISVIRGASPGSSVPSISVASDLVSTRTIGFSIDGQGWPAIAFQNENSGGIQRMYVRDNMWGLMGIPTATFHIFANSSDPEKPLFKLSSRALITTPQVDGIENDAIKLYFTGSSLTRRELTMNNIALTSGRLPIVGTGGFLNDLPNGANGTFLGVSGGVLGYQSITAASVGGWALAGNAGTNPFSNYIGTSDSTPLTIATNGTGKIWVAATGNNVGINNSNPTVALDIISTVANSGVRILSTAGGSTTSLLQIGSKFEQIDLYTTDDVGGGLAGFRLQNSSKSTSSDFRMMYSPGIKTVINQLAPSDAGWSYAWTKSDPNSLGRIIVDSANWQIGPIGTIGSFTADNGYRLQIFGSLFVNTHMRLNPQASAPGSPTKGMIYVDNTTNQFLGYNGSTWVDLGAGGGGGSGTVTSFTFTDGNGFDGTVSTATTTPTLSLTTTLTTGSIPFIAAGGGLSEDNASLFWENTGKMLGIGTNTPSAYLHIYGSSNASIYAVNTTALGLNSGSGVNLYATGTPSAADQRLGFFLFGTNPTGTTFRNSAAVIALSEASWVDASSRPTYMSFETTPSGSTTRIERMRISAAGNVGIGTTSPLSQLHVGGSATTGIISLNTSAYSSSSGGRMRIGNTGTPSAADQLLGALTFNTNPTGTTIRTPATFAAFSEAAWTDNSSHPTYLVLSTTASGSSTNVERMRINAAGFVGISTTAPESLLGVNATALGGTSQTSPTYNASGIILGTNTLAANNAQQIGATLVLRSNAWNTTTSSSNRADWRFLNLASQGATVSSSLRLQFSQNGNAFSEPFLFSSSGQFNSTTIVASGTITGAGVISTAGVAAGSAAVIQWSSRSTMRSAVNGDIMISNQAGTDMGSLQFGGTTSSFPALKRSTTNLQVRLGDDSAYSDLEVADEVYGPSWNGSLEVPTKNALYDKIESIVPSSPKAFVQYSNISNTSVSGTSTETTLVPTGGFIIGSKAVDGTAHIAAGTVFIMKGSGLVRVVNNGDTPTIRFKVGSITVPINITGLTTTVNPLYEYEAQFIFYGAGTSQTVEYIIKFSTYSQAGFDSPKVYYAINGTTISTTSGTINVDITAEWDIADVDNEVSTLSNYMEIKKI